MYVIILFYAKCLGLFAKENVSEQFTHKIDNQLIAHNHETTSRVNKKLAVTEYSKAKFQHAPIFRSIKLWNTTPDDVKN